MTPIAYLLYQTGRLYTVDHSGVETEVAKIMPTDEDQLMWILNSLSQYHNVSVTITDTHG